MGATGVNPGAGGDRETGLRLPQRPGDRQLRQLLMRRNDLDRVDDHAEAVAHVDDGRVDGVAGLRIEDQPDRILLAADAERMDFAGDRAP